MRVLVTGGLGFIGSAVIRLLLSTPEPRRPTVLNIDSGTYAATEGSVAAVADDDRYQHLNLDIADRGNLRAAVTEFRPDAIVHLAAETHVDRSIDSADDFVRTNVTGTVEMLQAASEAASQNVNPDRFRFIHISTDEVFGALAMGDEPFNPTTAYDPRSPYSASKAAADHFVRAWHETHRLPTVVINCSNNYGPYQFPEKLIPLTIVKARAGERLPVYGTGENIRDWLHVTDHAQAIAAALRAGRPGRAYTVGGGAQRTNLQVVEAICDLVDLAEGDPVGGRRELIAFVADRPGHDLRYVVDSSRAQRELGWSPTIGFDDGLRATVEWYLANEPWWRPLQQRYTGRRLGGGHSPETTA